MTPRINDEESTFITDDDDNGHDTTIAAVTIGSAAQQEYQQQQPQQQQPQQKQQQKHGLLSRFRFRRRGNTKHTTTDTENTNNNVNKNADDDDEEAVTIITMDDDDSYSCSSSSSSSSFDEIDLLLARPVMGTSYCDPIVLDKSTVVSSLSSSSTTAASVPVEAGTAITDQQQQQQLHQHQHQKNINAIIHDCLQLLSSTDIDQNRLALQRMELLLKGRSTSTVGATAVSSSSSSSSSDTMPHAANDVTVAQLLVYGGTLGSEAELVRYLFSTLICNTPETATSLDEFMAENTSCAAADDDDEEDADALFDWILEYDPNTTTTTTTTTTTDINTNNNYSDVSDEDEHSQEQLQQHPEGKADGILHTHALRILSHALDKLTSTTTTTVTFVENKKNNNHTTTTNTGKKGIASPLQGPMTIWTNIMQTLLDNIEHPARNINATGYSLRILRSLYEIEENEQYDDSHHHLRILRPLVQHSLVSQLVYLVDFGQHYHFPMIQTEALFLWNRCCPQTNTQH